MIVAILYVHVHVYRENLELWQLSHFMTIPWALTLLHDERTITMLPFNPCTESVGRRSTEILERFSYALFTFLGKRKTSVSR